MKRNFIASVFALGALASFAPTAEAQTPAVTYAATSTLSDTRPYTAGFAFNLSSSTTVTHLGVWSGGTLGDYLAGLWRIDGTLLASQTVQATDPVTANWRFASIAPLVLGAGDYVVAAEYTGGEFPSMATGVTRIPGLTWLGDRQLAGSGLNFPTVQTNTYGDNGVLWANFATGPATTVPEPSTWALMLVGLAAVGVTSRRRLQGRQTN